MLKRWFLIGSICVALIGMGRVMAAEFTCTNGEIVKGEPISFKEDGVVFRKDSGGYTDKIQWPRFTQDTLKVLAKYKDPLAAWYAAPFIEEPLNLKEKTVQPPPRIIVGDVSRVAYYAPDPGIMSSWLTPVGLMMLIALYVGNLAAGYGIARFRRKQPALVCGLSAVLPVVGPIIFLVLPEQQVVEVAPVVEEITPEQEAIVDPNISTGADSATKIMTRAAVVKDSTAAGMEPALYKKGEITFNRRFFETKFPTFFRPVLGPKEKSVMFVIEAGGKHYEGIRYSRVTTGEIFLVPMDGTGEVSISIPSIESVEVKPR